MQRRIALRMCFIVGSARGATPEREMVQRRCFKERSQRLKLAK
jgi:hypothetical protein